MPRANRHFLPDHIGHITHRCHEKSCLLKFARDRRRYLHWLYLYRCFVYIDLNRVRAGVVKHPAEWAHGGYREIQEPPKRYTVIDLADLSTLCGFSNVADFQRAHRQWVAQALTRGAARRDERWSEAIAVGSRAFVEKLKRELGIRARYGEVAEVDGTYTLCEPRSAYASDSDTKSIALRPDNTIPWEKNPVGAET